MSFFSRIFKGKDHEQKDDGSTFKAIHSAIINGSKLENLVMLPLGVNVAEDYNPYR